MSGKIECVVVGGGIVGLAVARALALRGRETLVLEAASAIGTGVSSRNSEVIHAGIYYPPDSARARLCVSGRRLLYAYCESRGVEHRRCGKLVVATDAAQIRILESLTDNARASGVMDLRALSGAESRELEPSLACVAALLSPSTGIVDGHGLMLALQSDLERAGGGLALRAPVTGGRCTPSGIWLEVGGESPTELCAQIVINAAALDAQTLARNLEGLPPDTIPPLHLAKGNYFALSGKPPFRHLIYPVPEPGGLGVHLTLDLNGRGRFGPDVQWVASADYEVDPGRAARFYPAIRRYWPDLPDGALRPDYAGLRPKLTGPGERAADFCIQGAEAHGVRGLVNLYGIESPGLTASLAIAEEVSARVCA